MNSFESVRVRIDPVTEEDRHLVRRELAELMNNLHFASSKRYPALLHYVVEKTLDGHSDELKERILGIEVFHRPSDYDTNNDTVVRVAAGEVRKRLALTYHEVGDGHAIQILLPTGSYVPEFYRLSTASGAEEATDAGTTTGLELATPDGRAAATQRGAFRYGPDAGLDTIQDTVQVASQTSIMRESERRRSTWQTIGVGVAMLLLGAASVLFLLRLRAGSTDTSVDRFWRPASSSASPVLLCAGSLVPDHTDAAGFTEAGKGDDYPYVSMATAGTLTSLVAIFAKAHTDYLLQPSSSATLTDMRQRTTVLLGAYNNKWTVLMLNQLRYRFTAKPLMEIVDTKNPSRVWRRPASLPYKDEDDFAIVARFHNSLTDSTMFAIAGVGKNGTEAAAQFVTSQRYLDLIDRYQRDWDKKNIEIVLKTTAVDSKTSAPSIEAIEVW